MITTLKTCFKCGKEKPYCEFYKHPKMADGHLGKCKECTKRDVRDHRSENLEKIREYDRNRPNAAKRNSSNKERTNQKYREDAEYREGYLLKQKRWSDSNPNKRKAHYKLSNAIRDGYLIKENHCSSCFSTQNIQAHHWSYLEEHWLDVIWLCSSCHGKEHKRINECERKGVNPYPNGRHHFNLGE